MGRNGLYPESVQPGIPRLGRPPAGWKAAAFGDVLEAVSRPAKLEDESVYRLVTAKRSRGGIILRGSKKGIEIKTRTQFQVKTGDFLISRRQIVHGGCGIVPPELDGAIVSNEYLVLHSKRGLLQDYLRWLSHSIYFQQACFHASIGVHVEKMVFRPDIWFRFRINLPPENEQRKIAAVISAWNSAIEQALKLLGAKQKLKKGLMEQLLTGNRRLPGFSSSWQKTTLAGVASITMGSSPPSQAYNEDGKGLPLLQGNADINNGRSAPRVWTSQVTKKCAPGDILMSVRAPIGEIAISDHHACIGRGICAIRANENFSQIYLLQALLLQEERWGRLAQGSTFTAINSKEVKALALRVPSEELERQKIATLLAAVDREMQILSWQIAGLKLQGRGLMHKLLTGQVRVIKA